jgi:dethiobiotin synthetase
MRGRLVVVTGTGTGIGKTHASEALLFALVAAGVRALGIKPVESGVDGTSASDSERLAAASSFHVELFAYPLRTAIAPHLAAEREGVTLDPERIRSSIEEARHQADLVLLELPGGLFSPLTPANLNADFASTLDATKLLLVSPDRLGVLHDVVAAVRAAATVPIRIDAVLLVAPEIPDLSTGTNAAELARLVAAPVLATVPRGTPRELALRLADAAAFLAR